MRTEFWNANAEVANATAEMLRVVTANMEGLKNNVQTGLGQTVDVLNQFAPQFEIIGGNYIVGLQNGMVLKTGALYAAVQRIGQNVVTTMGNSLGVQSPSVEGYYAGEMFGLGIENALYDKVEPVRLARPPRSSPGQPYSRSQASTRARWCSVPN